MPRLSWLGVVARGYKTTTSRTRTEKNRIVPRTPATRCSAAETGRGSGTDTNTASEAASARVALRR